MKAYSNKLYYSNLIEFFKVYLMHCCKKDLVIAINHLIVTNTN